MTHGRTSSTRQIPVVSTVPRHIAIIMDGNGRWARKRFMPRVAGHRRGVESVRTLIRACMERGVSYLTLFAFSSENWRRPNDEVSFLLGLFMRALEREVERLHDNGIRLRVIGDRSRFDATLKSMIERAEDLTVDNRRLTLTIAADYGGRWDVLSAVNRLHRRLSSSETISEAMLEEELALSYGPEPDLFIRTGGEQRISNFLLWQLAYTELYFTDVLWPEFDERALDKALTWYRTRERRFGRTSEQLRTHQSDADVAEPVNTARASGGHA